MIELDLSALVKHVIDYAWAQSKATQGFAKTWWESRALWLKRGGLEMDVEEYCNKYLGRTS